MTWNQAYATNWGRSQGILGANEVAANGLLDSRVKAGGLTNQYLAAQQGANAMQPNQNGVVPMTVEPLHQWEKSGLSGLASVGQGGAAASQAAMNQFSTMLSNPQSFAQLYTSPYFKQYLDSASGALADGTKPVTMEEIQEVANPYADHLKTQLSEEGERARAQITAALGNRGARSFGDTVSGNRLSAVDKSVIDGMGDINYKIFQDALGQVNTNRNRSFNAANGYQGLAGLSQQGFGNAIGLGIDGASRQFDMGRTALSDTIDAGKYVRSYNQGINDQIGSEIKASQNQDITNLQTMVDLIMRAYGGGSSMPVEKANSLQQVGAGLTGLYGLGKYLNTGTVNNLPWTSPGNVNPTGGFYL